MLICLDPRVWREQKKDQKENVPLSYEFLPYLFILHIYTHIWQTGTFNTMSR